MSDTTSNPGNPDSAAGNATAPAPAAFRRARAEGNERLRAFGSVFESFFALDGLAYRHGVLPAATKELLGLVISVVKDCEECVYYHLERCDEEQVSRGQVIEALQIALVGAGSVTVPLLRRAVSFMSQLPRLGEPGAVVRSHED
ncbi:carboxymuconolactone decarboxylase family protein [Nonomuraea sp. NPDC050153]|uniref:carboxymuconolactone decarboxylase family protein n=1 Tax=Nonomuraea sp. NPDC050153 TaxID=3364359 RepID=UPI00379EF1CE